VKEQKLDYSHIHENLEIYSTPVNGRGLVYGVLRHFQQYFSYIVVVSFFGEGNRSTPEKTSTRRKSLTNFIA
jgi:hypothetical protein